jgi:threonine/homoserine/homoserine lactone efflux protein
LLDPQLLIAYLAAATVLTLSPGPDTMFVLASSASGGPRAGVAATFGISTGLMGHATLAALGISALIAASPTAFEVLRLAGAFYLLWIGMGALRASIAALEATADAPPQVSGEAVSSAAYRRGLVTNLLNPKVAVFYVAFLPQFTSAALGYVPLQIVLLALIHALIGIVWLTGLSIVSGRAMTAMTRSGRATAWLNGAAGSIYILLALRMFFLERRAA